VKFLDLHRRTGQQSEMIGAAKEPYKNATAGVFSNIVGLAKMADAIIDLPNMVSMEVAVLNE